jgi:hypothetical protein
VRSSQQPVSGRQCVIGWAGAARANGQTVGGTKPELVEKIVDGVKVDPPLALAEALRGALRRTALFPSAPRAVAAIPSPTATEPSLARGTRQRRAFRCCDRTDTTLFPAHGSYYDDGEYVRCFKTHYSLDRTPWVKEPGQEF